ncbi:unnamed protein product [Rotaria sp. Silwood2]|nr:unnamed protein product [Rotaria sp. Silwood2]
MIDVKKLKYNNNYIYNTFHTHKLFVRESSIHHYTITLLANEDSSEHESTLKVLENRWQELHKQILKCEQDIEQSRFNDELQVLTKLRNEYQTWIDSTPLSSSNTENQAKLTSFQTYNERLAHLKRMADRFDTNTLQRTNDLLRSWDDTQSRLRERTIPVEHMQQQSSGVTTSSNITSFRQTGVTSIPISPNRSEINDQSSSAATTTTTTTNLGPSIGENGSVFTLTNIYTFGGNDGSYNNGSTELPSDKYRVKSYVEVFDQPSTQQDSEYERRYRESHSSSVTRKIRTSATDTYDYGQNGNYESSQYQHHYETTSPSSIKHIHGHKSPDTSYLSVLPTIYTDIQRKLRVWLEYVEPSLLYDKTRVTDIHSINMKKKVYKDLLDQTFEQEHNLESLNKIANEYYSKLTIEVTRLLKEELNNYRDRLNDIKMFLSERLTKSSNLDKALNDFESGIEEVKIWIRTTQTRLVSETSSYGLENQFDRNQTLQHEIREMQTIINRLNKDLIDLTQDADDNLARRLREEMRQLNESRRALELMLTDWPSVKSMLLCGCPDDIDSIIIKTKQTSSLTSTCSPIISTYNNENIFSLDEQQQTSQLDRFTYFLLVKCNTIKQTNSASKTSTTTTTTTNDLIDILLNTLLREISNPINHDIAYYVSARFVRSIIRLFIILNLQILSDKTSTINSTIKRNITNTNLSSSSTYTISQSIILQCKRIFQTLTIISVHSLIQMADLLLSPVRHGIAKPIAMFNLLSTHTDILQSLDEVFNIDSEYYRAYQRYPNNINDDLNEINNDNTNIDLTIDDDDNNSDSQSQHEIINPINNSNTTTTLRENLTNSLSDNESEMELELLAESDTDNESNHSALNTNTHRTSATAGSEHMTLFSDDDNSESDDADSVRSDSVLGEGDETSQHETMIFDDARDTLPVTTTTTTTTNNGTTTTNDRLGSVSSTNNNSTGLNTPTINSTSSHLSVPRLTSRTAITGLYLNRSNFRIRNFVTFIYI